MKDLKCDIEKFFTLLDKLKEIAISTPIHVIVMNRYVIAKYNFESFIVEIQIRRNKKVGPYSVMTYSELNANMKKDIVKELEL